MVEGIKGCGIRSNMQPYIWEVVGSTTGRPE